MQYYDIDKVKNFIEFELDKIIQNTTDEKIITDINQLKTQIDDKIKELEEDKRLILEPIVTQQFYKVFAGFMVVPDERKGYFLCLAIKSLIGTESIKKILKEQYKDKYRQVINAFNEYFEIMGEIRNTIDTIREDDKIRNNINNPTMKRYFKLCQKIPMIYEVPFHILGILFERTNLASMRVDKDALRTYEMEYKKPLYTLEQGRQLMRQDKNDTGGE